MTESRGKLFLLPVPLGNSEPTRILPSETIQLLSSLTHFVAENARTARRFLSTLPLQRPVQSLQIQELNEHTTQSDVNALLGPPMAGLDLGMVSEAGCPIVADPGAGLVALAHERGITVVPMVGPSAPLLAVMASGLSAQPFRFVGYVPQDATARRAALTDIRQELRKTGCTQVMIETPYRNLPLWQSIIEICDDDATLAIAIDLTLPTEQIVSKSIRAWKLDGAPEIHRRPAVFVLGVGPRRAGRPVEPISRARSRHPSPSR